VDVLEDAETLPITEGGRRGVSKLVADAESGHAVVLQRRAVPVAAVISYDRVRQLAAMERDLVDAALILSRAATDNGNRTSLDDVIAGLGYTREQLEALDDPA
jgi:antitoxin (DNA-binding transcriptional repressor) of toxin-antitoxin stability system